MFEFVKNAGRGIGWLWNTLGPAKRIIVNAGIEEFKRRNPKVAPYVTAIEAIHQEYEADPDLNFADELIPAYIALRMKSLYPQLPSYVSKSLAKKIIELKK